LAHRRRSTTLSKGWVSLLTAEASSRRWSICVATSGRLRTWAGATRRPRGRDGLVPD